MGNTFTSKNSIYIATEKPVYCAGETVTGNIYLNITSPEGFDIGKKGLELELEGYEKTEWEEHYKERVEDGEYENGRTKYRSVSRTREHKQKMNFMEFTYPIAHFDGRIGPGQYAFPFAIDLPPNLPGNFKEKGHKGLDKYEAKVYYRLEAELDAAKGWFGPSDLECEAKLVIHSMLQQQIQPVRVDKAANVMFCCCCDKGEVRMSCHFDKNCYVPGEVCQIVCEVENNSESEITCIRTVLFRQLTLYAKGKRMTKTDTIRREKFPGVAVKRDADGNLVMGDKEIRQLSINLQDDKHGKLQPETKGRLVQCRYWIEVECDIPWAPDIEITLPITIYAPQPENFHGTPAAPQGWNPQQTYDVKRFGYGQEYSKNAVDPWIAAIE